MAGEDSPGAEGEEEPNLYKRTLERCRDDLIPNAMDAVYDGAGDPGKPIADAISGGGWECTEADSWVSDLLQHTNKVMPAFEDAKSDGEREDRRPSPTGFPRITRTVSGGAARG